MSLKHAVLGLVIERPGYGYELTKRLGERVGGYQLADNAVYPALDSLERAGLIRRRDRDGRAHRQRIWFEATPNGHEEFAAWMGTPSEVAPLRGALRMKIAVATVDDLPQLIEETRAQERECLDLIELLSQEPQPAPPFDPDAGWAPTGRMLLRRTDVKLLQAQIEALQAARAEMKNVLRRRAAASST